MSLLCRLCQNIENNKILEASDLFLGTRKKFDYVLCGSCGSLTIKEIPNEIASFYKNYYSLGKLNQYSDSFLRNTIKKLLSKIKPRSILFNFISRFLNRQDDLRLKSFLQCKLQKKDPILDVGCGSGEFLRELGFLGYKNLTGVDPFIENNINHSNFKIYKKQIFDIEGKFKLIMFHHSLEHMENIQDVLIKINKILTDDGICLIRIPDIDSYSFRKFQGSWFSIHAPFHFALPSFQILDVIASRAGLQIKEKHGEHLQHFFLLSINHSLNISDYDTLGLRSYLESNKFKFFTIPPLFTRKEINFWNSKAKKIKKIKKEDWATYYLTKKSH